MFHEGSHVDSDHAHGGHFPDDDSEPSVDGAGKRLASIADMLGVALRSLRHGADATVDGAQVLDRSTPSLDHVVRSPHVLEWERALEAQAQREKRSAAEPTGYPVGNDHVHGHPTGSGAPAPRHEKHDSVCNERSVIDESVSRRKEFLAVLSHDLRNILSSMVGFAELIEAGVQQANHVEKVARQAQRIQRSGERMNALLGQLADLSSVEAGALTVTRRPGDPTSVIHEAVDAFQTQALAKNVSVTTEIQSLLPAISFDPARLLQVLFNLIENALKFTPAEGHVVVRVTRLGNDVLFAVRDSGTGIPADKLEAVFDRFVQVQSCGRRAVGLGLYIARQIVDGHGGRIWAESGSTGGTTILFTIPVCVPS